MRNLNLPGLVLLTVAAASVGKVSVAYGTEYAPPVLVSTNLPL
jgi:hypothetical protein